MKKKIILCITGLAIVAMIAPSSAQAVTAAELQVQINALMATLADLQSQLADLTGEPTGGTIAGCTITSFTRSLSVGTSGDDVKCLQVVLNSASDTQLSAGVGSPGQETSYFGPKTKAAVIKFQEKYAADVLATYGLTSGTGFVGTTTKAKLNTLLAAGEVPTTPTTPTTPAAAGLTVGLASDTPAAGSIASGASGGTGSNTDFTKIKLTAGSEGDVKISKIYVTRSGLAGNSDVENIKFVDAETNTYKGSIASLNVDNKAMITFTKKLVIPAGTTKEFFIRAGVPVAVSSGKTIKLGIATASDIVSDASEITGNFPMTGNAMTVVTLTIGSASVDEDGSTVDSTPDVGDEDITVVNFKIVAGATEAITIESITAIKVGTAEASDVQNIELFDVTNNASLGTNDSWDNEDKASWSNLNLVIAKGKTQRFKIKLDIVDGAGLTVNADLIDGSDVLINVKGNTYGFYITPTILNSWNGKGTTVQNINSGTLNISKSTLTPATGKVAVADEVVLGAFDFDARGEEMKISAITITLTTVDTDTCSTGTGFCADNVSSVTIEDKDGNIVAGPKNTTSTDANGDVDFTDTFIVPVGVHTYYVKGNIGTDAATSDTVRVDVETPDSGITAKGMTSNAAPTITPTTDVQANLLTVAAGSLNVVTLDTPAQRNVAKGINDFVWATGSLDAGDSGEDVQVSVIIMRQTVNTSGTAEEDIDNAEIWADLTSANSARGDVYETKVSNTEQWDAASSGATADETFTLSQVIIVPKGGFVRIALIADLSTDATADEWRYFTFGYSSASGITATGADTGSDVTEAVSGPTNSSVTRMTVKDNGTLTVTKDASSPVADILIGGETVTLNVFRLAADAVEDLDLDSIALYVTGGTDVDTYYFYQGSTLLGSRPGGTGPSLVLDDGTVTIPANGNIKVTVKAKMLPIDGNVVQDNTDIGATINAVGAIDTTGLSSGQAVDSTVGGVSSSVHQLYESRPYISVNSASPSGTQGDVGTSNTLLAIFDIKAHSAEDITFESDGQIIFKISMAIQASDGNDETFTFKDDDSNTLATITGVALGSGGSMASSVTLDFSTNTLTVPAGETKQIYVYADTSEMTASSTSKDKIQIWLDDATSDSIKFSVDNATTYDESAIILRGDIMAGTLEAS